ncbi:fukutin [Aplysia californica]|uniref:Fukutin n=1 Tax=Aplysia californica TaxID=6500 RepID=A0ABM0JSK7_APLCA|nr:fukutin [Aplysia californica]
MYTVHFVCPLLLSTLCVHYYCTHVHCPLCVSTTTVHFVCPLLLYSCSLCYQEAVKLLFHTCESSGLFVFAVEPSLLRALRVGTQRRLELWGQDRHDSVAVGVKDAGLDQMHLVMSAMRRAGYQNWVKVDADPRGLSVASQTSQRSVTTHFLLWVPVADRRPMVIHMVVFYKRGDHYWHSALSDPSRPPPFDMKGSSFHHAAGIYDLFELGTVTVDGVEIRYPNDTFAFLKEKESSEFIECDYKRAYLFNQQFPPDPSDRAKTFRRKSRQLLALTKKVLEALEIPFWLSSGTCLGWYRQCDLIPHTTDVDIGIFVKDFREEMVAAMETAGLVLTHRFGRESDSLELSFLYGDIKLDVFFFYETRDYSWNGGTQASTGAKFKYIFPCVVCPQVHFPVCRVSPGTFSHVSCVSRYIFSCVLCPQNFGLLRAKSSPVLYLLIQTFSL